MSRREADAFEAALTRGSGSAAADEAVSDLVRHAETMLARAATVTPSDDFRANLRERLMAEAPAALATAPRPAAATAREPRPIAVRRRIARLSAAAIVAVGGVGLVATSAQAVPGDLLYSVKRGVENVEMTLLHRSDADRGAFQLDQARERLAEAEQLAGQGDFERSAEALADFSAQADAGSTLLLSAYEADRDAAASVEPVSDFTVEAAPALVDLADAFGPGSTAPVESALQTLQAIVSQALNLCTTCASFDLPELRTSAATPVTRDEPDTPATAPVAPDATVAADPSTTVVAPQPAPSPSAANPAAPAPTTAPTTAPPAEIPIVTPLVEGLLGKDGLVPNLLGGLLGR